MRLKWWKVNFRIIFFLLVIFASKDLYSDLEYQKLDTDLSKESSTYVADPDPLDPLPQKQESLKDDEEPILDDIKKVLDTPTKKKKVSVEKKSDEGSKDSVTQKKTVQKKKTVKKRVRKEIPQNLNPDDPDLALEKRLFHFHVEEKTRDVTPTSEDEWGSVLDKSKSKEFIIQKGNTLESISSMLFGDSKFWPKIWAQNNAAVLNPHQIKPGDKITFYPGDSQGAPSVQVGKNFDIVSGKSADGRDYMRQNTEIEKVIVSNQSKKPVAQLPSSLPEHANKYFFEKVNPQVIDIQLSPHTIVPTKIPLNPYILSPTLMKTDYKILLADDSNVSCRENHFVKKVEKINSAAVTDGLYYIVDLVMPSDTQFKSTYIYKMIATGQVTGGKSMRIKGCSSLINTDSLVVSREVLNQLLPPNEIISGDPKIVEGLDFLKQNVFSYGQFIVINSNQFNEGQSYSIYSEDSGGVSGQMKLIKNMGTLGVAFVTDISNLMSLGDKVISTNNSNSESEPISLE